LLTLLFELARSWKEEGNWKAYSKASFNRD
jgi:hypothetical protein